MRRRTEAVGRSQSPGYGSPPAGRRGRSEARNENRPSRRRCPRSPRGSTRWPSALPLRYESFRRLKLFTASDGVGHPNRSDRLADIMHPDDLGPLRHGERHCRDAPGETLAGLPATELFDERLSRDADDDRMAEGYDSIQVSQEREVVLSGL